MNKLYVIGIGPGDNSYLTKQALDAINESEVICGYPKYIKNIEKLIDGKTIYESPMTKEVERCEKAIEYALSGKTTAMVSSGDAGVYGMAGLIYELAEGKDIEIEIIPGITSALSAAAELGSPLTHDFCIISLSDLLTPMELIEKRLKAASEAEFAIALYNPKSKGRPDHLKNAMKIIAQYRKKETPIGIVRHSGTMEREIRLTTLEEFTDDGIDMHTIVIVGNSDTFIKDGKMITPRGYRK